MAEIDRFERAAPYCIGMVAAFPVVLVISYAIAFGVGNPPVSTAVGLSICGGMALATVVLGCLVAQFLKRLFRHG